MHEILQQAQDEIADGYTAEAIDLLRNFIAGQANHNSQTGRRMTDYRHEILIKAAAILGLDTERRRGLLTQEQASARKTQISADILELIDEIDRVLAKAGKPLPVPTASVDLKPPATDEGALEKVFAGTLQSISWLHKGVQASRSVCRVVSPKNLGTGFVFGPNLVLTNNHVVPTKAAADETVVEFDFEEDERGRLRQHKTYSVDSTAPFATSPPEGFDFTILRILEAEGQPPVASWGVLPLAREAGIAVGAHVTIIQHPSGGPKKIAATANEVVNIFDHRLQYMTDTMPGSSGSPVFNDRWEVVALHHAGGNIVKNARGERFFANEGILMGDILKAPAFQTIPAA